MFYSQVLENRKIYLEVKQECRFVCHANSNKSLVTWYPVLFKIDLQKYFLLSFSLKPDYLYSNKQFKRTYLAITEPSKINKWINKLEVLNYKSA